MTTEPTNTTEDTADEFHAIGTATYSVEDNKLRFYPFARLSQADYDRVKAAGFKWAPKQELFVAPAWTPAREDLLLELCGEIDDEDYSALERAADRADRFSGYRDKRTAEAIGHADTFDAGPSAFGHQSAARAARLARRHDRNRGRACSQWAKAEYWQSRTEGVIANALHRADPHTRRGRIKTLETEQRKHEKSREEYRAKFALWQSVLTTEGADVLPEMDAEGNYIKNTVTPAWRLAYTLANTGYGITEYQHPRQPVKASLWSLLVDNNGKANGDRITAREAATLWLNGRTEPYPENCISNRWSDHYANRLSYERAMLANEGGAASDVEMIPGGWIRKKLRNRDEVKEFQIHAVNKSNATGKVVSVKVWDENRTAYKLGKQIHSPGLTQINIERAGEDCYRAPTAEELEAFTAATVEAKKAKKAAAASKPAAPPTINPTDEDAERLQALWNAKAKASYEKQYRLSDGTIYGEFVPTKIVRITQKQYSANSGGNYSSFEIVSVCESGFRPIRWEGNRSANNPPIVFKVRKAYGKTGWTGAADAVVILTDKPQKAIPLDWDTIEGRKPATPAAVEVTEPEPAPAIVDGEALLFS